MNNGDYWLSFWNFFSTVLVYIMVLKDLWADKHSSRRIRVVKNDTRTEPGPQLPSNEFRYNQEEDDQQTSAEQRNSLEILKAAAFFHKPVDLLEAKSDFYNYLNRSNMN